MEYIGAIIRKIHKLAKGLFFGLMVTTAWMAYRVCESALGGSGLPAVWESVVIVAAALVITYMIDNALYEHAVSANAELIKAKGWRGMFKAGGFSLFVALVLMVARFGFSGGATYFTGESTVAERQANPATDHTEQLTDLQKQKMAAISQAKKDRTQRAEKALEEANALADAHIQTAIGQGSPAEQKDYHAGEWIRASYSIAIKKAKREALAMRKEAQENYQREMRRLEAEIGRIERDDTWDAAKSSIQAKASAHAILMDAERWTYYLLDFILVFGGFLCSWLVAMHMVKNNLPMESFFPNKPGLLDVLVDTLESGYAMLVAQAARVPAWFKMKGSKSMTKVASMTAKASNAFTDAVVQYSLANDTTLLAEGAAATQEALVAKAKRNAQQKRNKAQQQAQREKEEMAQQQAQRAATAATVQRQTLRPTATKGKRIKKGAGNYRAYLSKAGRFSEKGDMDRALIELKKALEAIPDDHRADDRIEKTSQLITQIENAKNG